MGCGASSAGGTVNPVKHANSFEIVTKIDSGMTEKGQLTPVSPISSFRDWRECVSITTFINQTEDPQIFEYKFIESIGRGAHAEVYKVQHVETGTIMAAKIYDKFFLMRNNVGNATSPLDRVYREMTLMSSLRHPNTMGLVEVLDDDFTNSYIFIMPFADAGSLLVQETQTDPIPEEEAQHVFAQIAEALEYLHDLGIAHRDIKPENIMMFKDGRAVLADYSAAIALPDDTDVIDDTEGTPAFYSPEECTGEPYHAKPADVWALGVSLYIMIFGHLPFFEVNDGYFLSQLFKISQQIQFEPLKFDPHIIMSDDLRDLLEKMLDKNPETRLTAAQVLNHPWVRAANYTSGFDPYAIDDDEEEEEDV